MIIDLPLIHNFTPLLPGPPPPVNPLWMQVPFTWDAVNLGLAGSYPGDVGIETNPAVLFVERFDEASLAALAARWTDSHQTGMSFDSIDVPTNTPAGKRSLVTTPTAGDQIATHLYKVLSPAVTDTIFVRHYAKFVVGNPWHSGIWIGGNNPASAFPDFPSGSKPTGSDRFSAAFERQPDTTWQTYDYWGAMRADGAGGYFGDVLKPYQVPTTPLGQWVCVEHQIKLNTPTTGFGGEQNIWLEGTRVLSAALGLKGIWGPLPSANPAIFTVDPTLTSTFEGFQWRTTTNLPLNVIWLQNYQPDSVATLKFAQVVVATQYIGPLSSGGAVSYQLEIGTIPGGSDYFLSNVGNVLTYTVPLPNGTYYSRVRAVLGSVVGAASAEQVFYV